MSIKTPVVVVGGGPAGSTAAYYIGGQDVLIVDKKEFPRHKACGGGLINSHDWPKLFDNFAEIKDQLHVHPVDDVVIYWNTTPIFSRKGHFFDHVQRFQFDDLLLRAALRKTNVSFRRFSVTTIYHRPDIIVLSDGREEIGAKYVIGADGWNSVVAKNLNNPPLTRHQYGSCLEYDIACEPVSAAHLMFCYHKTYGYAWILPTSTGCYAGIGILDWHPHTPREYLDDYVDFCVRSGIIPKDHSIQRRFGAPDPIHVAKTCAENNILLTGDAMGLVKQVSGEGIYFAMLSGKIAGQTINRGDNVAEHYTIQMTSAVEEVTLLRNLPSRFFALPALKMFFFFMRHTPISRNLQDAFMNYFCRRSEHYLPPNSDYKPFK